MNLDELEQAHKLKAELLVWREALSRSQREVFKSANLIVTDAAHGYQGQQAQTNIALDRDVLVPFIEERIGEIVLALRMLRIEAA